MSFLHRLARREVKSSSVSGPGSVAGWVCGVAVVVVVVVVVLIVVSIKRHQRRKTDESKESMELLNKGKADD